MAEVKKLWWVKDPTETSETLADFMWEVDVSRLPNMVYGTGDRWEKEHTKLYTDEPSAKQDAEKRWKALMKKLDRKDPLPKEASERVVSRFKTKP